MNILVIYNVVDDIVIVPTKVNAESVSTIIAVFISIINMHLGVNEETDNVCKYVLVLYVAYTNPIVNGLVANTSNE